MISKNTLAFFLVVMMVISACVLSGTAQAQTYNNPCPSTLPTNTSSAGLASSSVLDKQIAQSAVGVAQAKLQNQQAARALFASLDNKLATCFTQVQAIFMAIGAHGDPLALLWTVAAEIIINMVQQVCSAVLSDLNQIKTFINSQVNRLCIPLPNFGLGLGGLNLKPVTCNGVSLLQPGPSTTGNSPINFDIRNLFPKSSSSSPANATSYP